MSSSENPHAGQGMVVLDIGADIGADLWIKPDGETAVTVEIAGGQITSASWPAQQL